MTALQLLAEWALRSSILILTGTLLLWMLRVKDPSIRLAAWTAILCGSLAIPALTPVLPAVPLMVHRAQGLPAQALPPVSAEPLPDVGIVVAQQVPTPPKPFHWHRTALILYALVALGLLLRLCVGLAMSRRLRRSSRPAGQATEGIEVRESDRITGPITLGIARPTIVLPADWREWDSPKLDAVLAHERSHVQRHDPAVQLLSAIHRSILWYSPLSWFLHTRIVRAAEEASDDSALAVTRDRALYAQVLLDFMQRGVGNPNWLGVPMARYAHPNQRIHRILDGTAISRGVTRLSLLAIFVLGTPLAYIAAAANPQTQARTSTLGVPAVTEPRLKGAATEPPVSLPNPVKQATPQLIAQSVPQPAPVDLPASDQTPQSIRPKIAALMDQVNGIVQQIQAQQAPVFLNALGNVTAFNTVTIKSNVDGQLISVDFKEGEPVQAGQVLASIDSRDLPIAEAQQRLELALEKLAEDIQARLSEVRIQADKAAVDKAKLLLTYGQIKSPITGVAGFRLVDPGNIVHAGDNLVVITQVQPIAVFFNIAEDNLPQVRSFLKKGVTLRVEARNRDNTVTLATGRLVAVDNQIDNTTGTVKLKAEFENKDEALYPNQFVTVRMLLNP